MTGGDRLRWGFLAAVLIALGFVGIWWVGSGKPAVVPVPPPAVLVDPADTDADGLKDEWEQIHFGSLSQGPDDDPDGDGLRNRREHDGGPAFNPNQPTVLDTGDRAKLRLLTPGGAPRPPAG